MMVIEADVGLEMLVKDMSELKLEMRKLKVYQGIKFAIKLLKS